LACRVTQVGTHRQYVGYERPNHDVPG
jgi:hypothetical protein